MKTYVVFFVSVLGFLLSSLVMASADDSTGARGFVCSVEEYPLGKSDLTEEKKIVVKDCLTKYLGADFATQLRSGNYTMHGYGYSDSTPVRGTASTIVRVVANTGLGYERCRNIRSFMVELGLPRWKVSCEADQNTGKEGVDRKVEVMLVADKSSSLNIEDALDGLYNQITAKEIKPIVAKVENIAKDVGTFPSKLENMNKRLDNIETAIKDIKARPQDNQPSVWKDTIRTFFIHGAYYATISKFDMQGGEMSLQLDWKLTTHWSFISGVGAGFSHLGDGFGNGLGFTTELQPVYNVEADSTKGWKIFIPGLLYRNLQPDATLDGEALQLLGTAGVGYCWSHVCTEVRGGFGLVSEKLADGDGKDFGVVVMPALSYRFDLKLGGNKP